MPKIAGNEIRPGTMIEHQGGLWMAVKTQAVKPGKGGAYNQVELKNILTGTKLNERFRSDEGVEEIYLDKKDFQFLFASGDVLTFMSASARTKAWKRSISTRRISSSFLRAATFSPSWISSPTTRSSCRRISSASARSSCRTA
jgi:translation elongation factor P/translation initiation factor 5A